MLSSVAKWIAHSTRIVGYRGAGRLFRPVSGLAPFLKSEGKARIGSNELTFPAFDPYWAQYLWTGKTYEPDVQAIFRSLAHIPDKLLIDCGANIGYWTVTLADPRFGFTKFIAIEPNPYVFTYLRRNVEANRIQARLYPRAVSAEEGSSVLIDSSRGHATGHLSDRGTPVETVTIASLIDADDLGTAGRPRTAVVKLDVEGSEVDAIRGTDGVPLKFIFVYEDWPHSNMPVTAFLLSQGYSIWGIDPNGRRESIGSTAAAIEFNRRTFPAQNHCSNLVAAKWSPVWQ